MKGKSSKQVNGAGPDLLTLAQMAERLQCHHRTLRLLIKAGLVPAGRIGPRGSFRLDLDMVLKALRQQAREKTRREGRQ